MMSEEEAMELDRRISDHLAGRLPAGERERFEQELSVNAGLRERVALERLMREAYVREDVYRFRLLVRDIERSYEAIADQGALRPTKSAFFRIAMAAGVLLLIAIGAYLWLPRQSKVDFQTMALVDVGIPKYRSVPTVPVVSSHQKLVSGFSAYGKGLTSSESVLHLVEELLDDSAYMQQHGDEARLIQARILIHSDRALEALPVLTAGPHMPLYQCAYRYYQALAYAELHKPAEASDLLRSIGCEQYNKEFGTLSDMLTNAKE